MRDVLVNCSIHTYCMLLLEVRDVDPAVKCVCKKLNSLQTVCVTLVSLSQQDL